MEAPLVRFFKKFYSSDRHGDCWEWLGHKNTSGYGIFSVKKQKFVAHRWIYELIHGQVPDLLDLDHLCRNRACVNPYHLEPVTRSENSLRGVGPLLAGLRQSMKTECAKGHAFNADNTYYRKNGSRKCRACHRIEEAKRRTTKQRK